MNNQSELMKRCFKLALNGQFLAPPNPYVGSIITYNDHIIAEGYHHAYGLPHAEIDAINNVRDKSILSRSTIYVNLEPCSHYGKTPPCAEAIVKYGFKRIVIGTKDTSKKVDGKGIELLRQSGIEVIEGIEESKARFLNRRFFTFHERGRPYIILKWAETADGFIARSHTKPEWISNEASRELAHIWRPKEMAILVGRYTALHDNPQLTARPKGLSSEEFRNPLRITIDKDLSLPNSLYLLSDSNPTIVLNSKVDQKLDSLEFCKIDFKSCLIQQLMDILVNRKITSLIVEGGSITLDSFIKRDIWDEIRIFRSNKRFETGIQSPNINDKLQIANEKIIGDDRLLIYTNHDFGAHLQDYE